MLRPCQPARLVTERLRITHIVNSGPAGGWADWSPCVPRRQAPLLQVRRMPGGRPTVVFHGKAGEFFAKLGGVRAHLSITHTKESAMAYVIIESE